MSTDFSFYPLGSYETLWKDDCSVCPAHIEFDVAANCDRQSVVDGRCFRGDFGEEIKFWAYHFQFPPEWSTGSVAYTYSFRYWALGSWESSGGSLEGGGTEACAPGHSYFSAQNCIEDMNEVRNSETTCSGWSEWSAPDGSFDPYVQWVASGGDDGNAQTACFLDKSYSHSTDESTLTVGFYTWDWDQNTDGISGPRANEAWVVSDFEIEFTPPPFTSLKPDTTKTTAVKTSTTDAPTTTSELPTTKQTTDDSTTNEAVTDSTEMADKSTTTEMDIVDTTKPTTTDVTNDDKGDGEFLAGIVLYGVVGGALFCALFCFVFIWNWNGRKSAQPKDEECVSETRLGKVYSLSEIRMGVSSKPSEIAEDHGADDKEHVIVEKSEAAVELQTIGQLPVDDIVEDASDSSLQPVRGISEAPVEVRVAAETRMLPPIPRPLEQVTAYGEVDGTDDEEFESEGQLNTVGGVSELLEEIRIHMDSKLAVYGEDDGTDDEDFGTLEEVVIQLKADARTAEDKAFAKRLDAALRLAPDKMEAFSMLLRMGVDSQHIGQLLAQKADIILQAEGVLESEAAAGQHFEGTTAGR